MSPDILAQARPGVRSVFIDPRRAFEFGDYQLNYTDFRTRRLIASTDVWYGDYIAYQVNSLGCKGRELQGGKPVVAFFGDSVVHGNSGSSFADEVSIDGCESLNAGIEGLQLPWIVDRFEELRSRVPIVCAAVHAGWHNLVYNTTGEAFWAQQLDRIKGVPVIAHFRLFADISEATLDGGYDEVMARSDIYTIWPGASVATREERAACKAVIDRFNHFIEAYCRDRGRILIDLEPVMAPAGPGELGVRFDDLIHPKIAAYPVMARTIEAALEPTLRPLLQSGQFAIPR